MGKGGAFFNDLLKFQKKLSKKQEDKLFEKLIEELAQRLLKKVKKRTPVDYGTLRGNWTISSIQKVGNEYQVKIVNPMRYASYVEYGHRGVGIHISDDIGWRTLHTDTRFTPGVFMLTISKKELEKEMPGILKQHFAQYFKKKGWQ